MWVCYWINNETDEIGVDSQGSSEEKLKRTHLDYDDWEEDCLGLHANPERFPNHSFFIEQYEDLNCDLHYICEQLYETRDERIGD